MLHIAIFAPAAAGVKRGAVAGMHEGCGSYMIGEAMVRPSRMRMRAVRRVCLRRMAWAMVSPCAAQRALSAALRMVL